MPTPQHKIGSGFGPIGVPAGMNAVYENVSFKAIASPFVPSSKNCCDADPPIELRSPVTVIPVLVGFAPGATATVRSVLCST